MFTIRECAEGVPACNEDCREHACALCERFNADFNEGDRIFVLDDGGAKAVGVLGLKCGKVVVKGVFGNVEAVYKDLIVRAMLNVCRNMNPITVRVESADVSYYSLFGFKTKDGGLEVQNKSITF